MKSTVLVACVATLFSRAVFSAPVAVSIASPEFGQSGYNSYVGAAPREEELSTAGRSGYNSVGAEARLTAIAAETGGRSGYNSVGIATRAGTTELTTDGRSGYNSVGSAERDVAVDGKTDGRSGYN